MTFAEEKEKQNKMEMMDGYEEKSIIHSCKDFGNYFFFTLVLVTSTPYK